MDRFAAAVASWCAPSGMCSRIGSDSCVVYGQCCLIARKLVTFAILSFPLSSDDLRNRRLADLFGVSQAVHAANHGSAAAELEAHGASGIE